MNSRFPFSYVNGNVSVRLYKDGTKTRRCAGEPREVHPENIEIKITDRCYNDCPWCYEGSSSSGLHAPIGTIIDKLYAADLPRGIELAVGGGDPLSHPNLRLFLSACKDFGFVVNLTVNHKSLDKYEGKLRNLLADRLLCGLGLSVSGSQLEGQYTDIYEYENTVFHLIVGVDLPTKIDEIRTHRYNPSILLLGYKFTGRGGYVAQIYHSSENIDAWYRFLYENLGKCKIAVDTAAIAQLNVKQLFTDEGWEKFYMGDETSNTMYIDAVSGGYAPSSGSLLQTPWNNLSIRDYWNSRER